MEAQEILQDIYFVLLYGFVIGLSVAAALYLQLRRGNAIAPEVKSPVRLRRWAEAFLVAIALSHVFWVFYAKHPTPAVYWVVCGLDMFMLYPTITGVLVSMLQDRKRPVWPVLVALVPALVLVALCIIRGDEVLFLPLSIYAIALYALIILYMVFAVRKYGRWLRDNYADLENKEVWQSFIILAIFLLFFVMYNSISENGLVLVYIFQIGCIIIVALLLWRVETLPELTANAVPEAERENLEQEQKRKASKMDALLKKQCESKQLYLQNDLTLAQLSGAIGTNRTYLSQHFAQQGITYNAYINGLRIRHFVRLYQEAVADGRAFTAQQLASESGYRSYSTFSTTFKQVMGTTVAAWMRSAGK
ncbi:MAG: AraC family transcriptional regulator [Bacteroidales bacterium]|nr:AraC family transcriptional regulator [Bacteroidales bacterium]